MGYIQGLVELTVPWAKPSPRANPWWTAEIQELVQEERQLRRRWLIIGDKQARVERLEKSQKKKMLIAHEKRKAFRTDIHNAVKSPEALNAISITILQSTAEASPGVGSVV
jgi:hypothetical protein